MQAVYQKSTTGVILSSDRCVFRGYAPDTPSKDDKPHLFHCIILNCLWYSHVGSFSSEILADKGDISIIEHTNHTFINIT